MKNAGSFFRIIAICLLLGLPAIAQALTQIEIERSTVVQWINAEEVVTVPTGTAYKVPLAGGNDVVLGEDTVFKVTRKEGKERIVIISGTALFDGSKQDDGTAEIEAGGVVISSDGADMVISVDDSGTSVGQLGEEGTVSVGGGSIPVGSSGTIGGDGSFIPDDSFSPRLSQTTEDLRLSSSASGGDGDAGDTPPAGGPLPGRIDQENLNDVTPS